MVHTAIRRATIIPGFFVARRSRPPFPLFRAYLPESWRREQFERWLEQHSGFFALDLGAASPRLSATLNPRGV
jgi:hypothetical protein